MSVISDRRGLLGATAFLVLAATAPATAQVADEPARPRLGQTTDQEPQAPGPVPLGADQGRPGGTPRDESLQLPEPADADLPGAVGDGVRRGDTVLSRRRPEFDPPGVPVGPFTMNGLATAWLGYDTNVFRQSGGGDDAFGRLRLDTNLRSNYSRHAVLLDGFVDGRAFTSFSSEDAVTYGAHGQGRFDIDGRSSVTADVGYEHQIIDRGAVGEVLPTRSPIRYDITSASLSARRTFGRLTLDAAGLVSRFDYQDARSPAGLPVDQDFRDFSLYELRLDAAYGRGAGLAAFFVSVAGEARRFRLDAGPINRDSDVYEILGGVRGDITPLLRGQLGLGYIYGDFKDPSIDSIGALGINARLDYLITDLTTVRLSGRRQLQNVGSAISAASLTTQVALGVDHELLRNLILSADVGYQHADFVGEDRSSSRYTAGVQARYFVNRRWRLGAELDYVSRDVSTGEFSDFSRIRASVSAGYAF